MTAAFSIYVTDFHTFRLTDSFVAAANARWPDRRYKRQPKWALKVHKAMNLLAGDIYLGLRRPIHTLRSIKTLEPYLGIA